MPVSASWQNLSSFRPLVFQSTSDQTHLFFIHEEDHCDYIGLDYYHTYELEDGDWSVPRRIPSYYQVGTDYILTISPSEKGFTIYAADFFTVWTVDYDEQANEWLEPTRLFESKPNSILVEDEVVYLSSINKSSAMVTVTKITASSIDTQTIYGQEFSTLPIYEYYSINFDYYHFPFIRGEDSLFLYSPGYQYRAEFANGTWSDWQPTDFACSRCCLVNEQYIIGQINFSVFMVDLTADNLTTQMLVIDPLELDLKNVYDHDVEVWKDTPDETVFIIATLDNETNDQNRLDLWMLNFTAGNLTKVASLKHKIKGYQEYDEYIDRKPSIDLLLDESNVRVFWDYHKDYNYDEIYTATYDPATNEWSPKVQITDTNTFLEGTCPYPLGWDNPIYFIPVYVGFITLLIFGVIAVVVVIMKFAIRHKPNVSQ
ncbi:MAG: hypothetical protein ACFFCZ_12565 [Promethearchaeota archaeon]